MLLKLIFVFQVTVVERSESNGGWGIKKEKKAKKKGGKKVQDANKGQNTKKKNLKKKIKSEDNW